MLAQQRIDIERAARVAGRIDGPDLDMRPGIGGIDLLQVRAGHRIERRAGNRIARHPAAEVEDAPGELFLLALTEKVDLADDQPGFALVHALGADIGDQPAIAHADLDLAPDLPRHRYAGIVVIDQHLQTGGVEQHLRARSGNFHDLADAQMFDRALDHQGNVRTLGRAGGHAPLETARVEIDHRAALCLLLCVFAARHRRTG